MCTIRTCYKYSVGIDGMEHFSTTGAVTWWMLFLQHYERVNVKINMHVQIQGNNEQVQQHATYTADTDWLCIWTENLKLLVIRTLTVQQVWTLHLMWSIDPNLWIFLSMIQPVRQSRRKLFENTPTSELCINIKNVGCFMLFLYYHFAETLQAVHHYIHWWWRLCYAREAHLICENPE